MGALRGVKVMQRSIVILLAASALAGLAGIAHADVVYQWTDAKGQVHYTDQWVPGAKLIRTETAHPSTTGTTPGIQSASNAADGQIKQQNAAQAVQADEDKARAARCTQEKTEYQKLIDSRRIYTTDKSGERHYLSDSDADAARVKARQAMDADCGSGG
jgi:Domain of unknown function (DUF4124)